MEVTLKWVHGCNDTVQVAGSWDGWVPRPMRLARTKGSRPEVWSRKVTLPPTARVSHGQLSYKFVVDGQWRHDPDRPTVLNPFGTFNNTIEVHTPEELAMADAPKDAPASVPEASVPEVQTPEAPAQEEPKQDAPITEDCKTDTPATKTPGLEEPNLGAPAPKPEDPVTEESKPEAPAPEATPTEEPKPEVAAIEEPAPETTSTEESKFEALAPQAVATKEPKPEAAATEEPKPETPAPQAPSKEEIKPEAPATEEPKAETPTTEEPKPVDPAPESSKSDTPTSEVQATEEPKLELSNTAPVTEVPVPEKPKTEATECLPTSMVTHVVSTIPAASTDIAPEASETQGPPAETQPSEAQETRTSEVPAIEAPTTTEVPASEAQATQAEPAILPTSMVTHVVATTGSQGEESAPLEQWKKDAFEDMNKNTAVHNVVATEAPAAEAKDEQKAKTYKVVMIRHGESEWNKENRFCGWYDAGLSPQGMDEAVAAGKALKENGFDKFDLAHTSVLQRAQKTLKLILEQTGQTEIQVEKTWRLNERHYGGLTGLNKAETAAKHGDAQVQIWRRSFDVPPPPMEADHPYYEEIVKDVKYHEEPSPGEFPMFESLKLTIGRTLPYWDNVIVPQIKQGKQILIAAHGNSLRGVVKHLDQISDDDIMSLNLPTGIPFVYELDENMKPVVSMQFLGDEETVKKAMEAVANQGKAKKAESAPEKADAKEEQPKKSEEVETKSQGSETKAEGSETKAEGNETKAEEKGSEGTPESAAAPHTEPAAEVKSQELVNGEQ